MLHRSALKHAVRIGEPWARTRLIGPGFSLLLLATACRGVTPQPRLAPRTEAQVASSFQFPTDGFAAGSTHGRRFLSPPNHLGDDSTHPHLAPVFAIGNDVVRHVSRPGLSGYGSVVAVEHQLPDGEVVVSIYGHLCSHDGHRIPVGIGEAVTKGTTLGYIGDDDENGHGPEHIHLGIRRGEYDGVLCGYTGPAACTPSHFYDPTQFIRARRSAS